MTTVPIIIKIPAFPNMLDQEEVVKILKNILKQENTELMIEYLKQLISYLSTE